MSTTLLLASILATVALLVRYVRSRRASKYPPGPPGKPFVGNILDVSPQGAWVKFTSYKDIYGDIVYFHGLGNSVLVLNSLEVIADLLEKKASSYSDRPTFTVVGELMNLFQGMPLLPYGPEWRTQRKLAHSALSPSSVKKYHIIQEDLAAMLCREILDDPKDFFSAVRLAAERLVLIITYGLSADTADSQYISHADETMHMITKYTVPGAFLCDLLPWMKYLPSWLPFQREAARGREMIERLVATPFEHVQRDMAAGIARPSLTLDLLSSANSDPNTLHHIKWMSGALYGAGGETTYSTVLTCILAMVMYPDQLRKAQEELDRVTGTDRLPTISDRGNLPYVTALIKEVMRWRPVLPLGLARATAADDTYRGYTIPKGTIVIPNVWAIAFEPRGLYSPEIFEPERWLVSSKEDMPVDPADWTFGFARRICPGKHLAENSLFIFISTLLAMFDFAPPDTGHVKVEFEQGMVSYPKPFECKITPRSESKAMQIRERASQSTV
ncbi:cytochrome P450 [Trametes coccinea BRFM310]|uniref:Cytochrome P450 n=1 Tax=Trametes coccinea (strain BRFM310) TaxID=1353009 RepID=A0A1Y2I7N1_TRAC3|nr:cytochrome P450 [Trametes coccinea BRFM310]